MANPIILLVDDDRQVLHAVERDLQKRYRPDYGLMKAASGHEAVNLLTQLKERNDQVALLIADQRMPGMSGTEFLLEACTIFPHARKMLLTAYADTDAAIMSINQVGIDYYLQKPWTPPEEKLYPILDDLLADWLAAVRLPYMRIKGVMANRIARIHDDANLQRAAEMVALSGVSDLMVVTADGSFVGVLSEGDILRAALPDVEAILEEGGTLDDAYQLFLRKGKDLANMPIAPLVIREPTAVGPEDHVAKAATVFASKPLSRLPVLDDGQLVGTVSRADICQAVVGML